MTVQAAKRASSRHEPANELIAKLREVATQTAKLGDELVREAESRRELEQEWALRNSEGEAAVEELSTWRELLEDYRRGIIDRDELLRETVGRA